MTDYLTATLVDESTPMTLAELARAIRAREEEIHVWVIEGVLQPMGRSPGEASLRDTFARRKSILVFLRNGALVFLPLVVAYVLISFFYLSRGGNPSDLSGPVHFMPEAVVFPLASPLTSASTR